MLRILRFMNTLTLHRSTILDAPADAVWKAVTTPRAFVTVTRGLLRFPVVEGRSDQWQEGEEVVGWTWIFGFIPFNRHHLTVARIDHDARVLSSDEHGGMVKRWLHDIVIEPVDDRRCRYTDRVEINASWATPAVAVYAWFFYRARQRRWQDLARRLARQGQTA